MWGLSLYFLFIFVCEENYLYANTGAPFQRFSLTFCAKQMITSQRLSFNYLFGDKLIFLWTRKLHKLVTGNGWVEEMKWKRYQRVYGEFRFIFLTDATHYQLITDYTEKAIIPLMCIVLQNVALTLVSSISYRSTGYWETCWSAVPFCWFFNAVPLRALFCALDIHKVKERIIVSKTSLKMTRRLIKLIYKFEIW